MDAAVSNSQLEKYALSENGEAVPVGSLIAREMIELGATDAVFTELWANKLVLVGPDLVCVAEIGKWHDLFNSLREACGPYLGGLPDVIALFPDGRIVMREAKNVVSKDKVQKKQREFYTNAKKLFGDRLEVAVVKWGI